ncbi:MAG: rubrerythrin [Candidatus Eisenbacteria bacterium]|nr:rubrerythrin [Candidatus Eisenbacteria bacterium]
MTLKNVDEILDYAIEREQEAHDFYVDLARRMDREEMKEVFLQFSQEELGHKRKLEAVKAGRTLEPSAAKVTNLKIAEYVVDVEPGEELDYQKALIVAMKKEKAAFKLYSDLSAATESAELATLFTALAQEEARHKLRFEREYDDVYLAEN